MEEVGRFEGNVQEKKPSRILVWSYHAFYLLSILVSGIWLCLGIRLVYSNISQGLANYLVQSEMHIPGWLSSIANFLAILFFMVVIFMALMRFVVWWCLDLFLKPSGSYFDPESSIETCVERDKETLANYQIKCLLSFSFLLSYCLLNSNYDLYFWCTCIFFVVFTSFQAWVVLQSLGAKVTKTYHFKTKAAYDFYLSMMGGGWSEDSQLLYEKIDTSSTDFAVARKLRARAIGETIPDAFSYDYIAGGDPSIHYGPYSQEDLESHFEEHRKYEESDERVG